MKKILKWRWILGGMFFAAIVAFLLFFAQGFGKYYLFGKRIPCEDSTKPLILTRYTENPILQRKIPETIYVFSPDEEREISEILQRFSGKPRWKHDWFSRETPEFYEIYNLKVATECSTVDFDENGKLISREQIARADRAALEKILAGTLEKIARGNVNFPPQKVFEKVSYDEFFGWKFENEIRGNADKNDGNAENSVLAGTHFVVDFDLLNRVKIVQKFDGNAKIWERNYIYRVDDREFSKIIHRESVQERSREFSPLTEIPDENSVPEDADDEDDEDADDDFD